MGCAAGPNFNERGVVMHGGGTLVWKDGRRAQLDCGFMRNLVQTVQVLQSVDSRPRICVLCQPAGICLA